MALANSRPLSIPTVDDDIIANSKSPLFDASSLGNASNKSAPKEAEHTTSKKSENKAKKTLSGSFTSSQLSEMVSISKTIPVTGERPKPTNEGTILNEDDVLFAIFVILWESDSAQQGMTVKQLCDLLLEKHPEMSNLSTKLSNLISAKLNAYVKKVEKGEKGLNYALSREWSDASPRRMVYIYRGILVPEYEKHAQAAVAALAAAAGSEQGPLVAAKNKVKSKKHSTKNASGSEQDSDGSRSDSKDSVIPRTTSAMGGLKSTTFSAGNFVNDFNVPYMSSPVSVSLTPRITELGLSHPCNDLDAEFNETHSAKRLSMNQDRMSFKKLKTEFPKQSDGHSNHPATYTAQQQQQAPYVTIASSTPRLSRSSSKHNEGNNNASSDNAQTIADILKTVVTQNPIVISPKSSKSSSPFSSVNSSQDCSKCSEENGCRWLRTLRGGFLLEEIATPESLSPDHFDEFFA